MEEEKVVDAIIARLNDEKSLFGELMGDYEVTNEFSVELKPVGKAVADMIEALGRIRNSKAIKPIISTLKSISGTASSELFRVIENGIKALGEIGDPEAVDHIITYFGYGEYIPTFIHGEDIRRQAVIAITRIGGDPAVDALIKLLGGEEWGSLAKQNALQALVQIGDERAVEHIIPLLNDDDPNLRGRVALALSQLVKGEEDSHNINIKYI